MVLLNHLILLCSFSPDRFTLSVEFDFGLGSIFDFYENAFGIFSGSIFVNMGNRVLEHVVLCETPWYGFFF